MHKEELILRPRPTPRAQGLTAQPLERPAAFQTKRWPLQAPGRRRLGSIWSSEALEHGKWWHVWFLKHKNPKDNLALHCFTKEVMSPPELCQISILTKWESSQLCDRVPCELQKVLWQTSVLKRSFKTSGQRLRLGTVRCGWNPLPNCYLVLTVWLQLWTSPTRSHMVLMIVLAAGLASFMLCLFRVYVLFLFFCL